MGLRYLLNRLVVMVPVFFVVVTSVFFMVRFAPGGPFDEDRKVPPSVLENLNKKYHLDEPLYQQYFRYLSDLARFDLGPSFKHANRTVNEILAKSFPVSLELGFFSILWALVIGVVAGSIAALRPNTVYDYVPMAFSIMGICLPTFVIGPLLILVFGHLLDHPLKSLRKIKSWLRQLPEK